MRKLSLFTCSLILTFQTGIVLAQPTGAEVVQGQASFSEIGNTLNITNTNGTVINWQDFSNNAGEITRFIQDSANSSVMNKVIGGNISKIYGDLISNGRVFLINQNGIIVGPTGRINTAAFFASTHDLSIEDFNNGGSLLFKGQEDSGAIVNMGKISATGGDVFLIANQVTNEGEISAPEGTVGLAASGGADVLIADGEDRSVLIQTNYKTSNTDEGVVNTGTIDAAKAELAAAGGNVYALAINNNGAVRAKSVQRKGGQIMLVADGGEIKLGENSVIDASGEEGGGEVLIGGNQEGQGPLPNAEQIIVETGSQVKADATENGDGGRIIVFAGNNVTVDGIFTARGGESGGDGGFIEVSGKQTWQFDNWLGNVDVSANSGKDGTFLIDPSNITIRNGAGAPIGASPVNTNTLNDADIENFLTNNGSLVVTTAGGTGGTGQLNVTTGASISWATANDLTLNADTLVKIDRATISSTGSGNLTIRDTNADNNTGAFVGVEINNSTISVNEGDLSITGFGQGREQIVRGFRFINADNASGIEINNSTIRSTGTGADAGKITLNGTGDTINLIFFSDGNKRRGVHLLGNTRISSVDGDINITGTGGRNGESDEQGILIESNVIVESTGLTNNAANISLTGTSRNRRAFTNEDRRVRGYYGNNVGVRFQGVLLQGQINAVNGDISLSGTTPSNLSSENTNDGISVSGGRINVTGDGNVSLTGTTGHAPSQDIDLSNATIGGANALGNITINGNEYQAAGTTNVQSRGTLTIAPISTGQSIGVGGGTGNLNISDAEFAMFQDGFTAINIGDASNGTGTFNIDTLTINDTFTAFGGTVNATGPVQSSTPTTITPTTGTAGTVNFASFADPTTNPAIPAAPSPAAANTSTSSSSSNAQQTNVELLNDVLDENYIASINFDNNTTPDTGLNAILHAAISNANLRQDQLADNRAYLEEARKERQRQILRERAYQEYKKRLAEIYAKRKAERIADYNAHVRWQRRTLIPFKTEAERLAAYEGSQRYLRSDDYKRSTEYKEKVAQSNRIAERRKLQNEYNNALAQHNLRKWEVEYDSLDSDFQNLDRLSKKLGIRSQFTPEEKQLLVKAREIKERQRIEEARRLAKIEAAEKRAKATLTAFQRSGNQGQQQQAARYKAWQENKGLSDNLVLNDDNANSMLAAALSFQQSIGNQYFDDASLSESFDAGNLENVVARFASEEERQRAETNWINSANRELFQLKQYEAYSSYISYSINELNNDEGKAYVKGLGFESLRDYENFLRAEMRQHYSKTVAERRAAIIEERTQQVEERRIAYEVEQARLAELARIAELQRLQEEKIALVANGANTNSSSATESANEAANWARAAENAAKGTSKYVQDAAAIEIQRAKDAAENAANLAKLAEQAAKEAAEAEDEETAKIAADRAEELAGIANDANGLAWYHAKQAEKAVANAKQEEVNQRIADRKAKAEAEAEAKAEAEAQRIAQQEADKAQQKKLNDAWKAYKAQEEKIANLEKVSKLADDKIRRLGRYYPKGNPDSNWHSIRSKEDWSKLHNLDFPYPLHPSGFSSLRNKVSYNMSVEEIEKLDMASLPGLDDQLFIASRDAHGLKNRLKEHHKMAKQLADDYLNYGKKTPGEEELRYSSLRSLDTPADLSPLREARLTNELESFGLIPKFKNPKLQNLSLEKKIALGVQLKRISAAQKRIKQAEASGNYADHMDKILINGGVELVAEYLGGDPTGGIMQAAAADVVGELAVKYGISPTDILSNPIDSVGKGLAAYDKAVTDFVTDPVNTTKDAVVDLGNTGVQVGKTLFNSFTGGGGGESEAQRAQRIQRERQQRVDALTKFRDNLVGIVENKANAQSKINLRKAALKEMLIQEAKSRDAQEQIRLAEYEKSKARRNYEALKESA